MNTLNDNFYDNLGVLFDRRIPNSPMLFSVLFQRNPGTILVDKVKTPTQCIVRDNQGWTFRSSKMTTIFLQKGIEYLLDEYGMIKLISINNENPLLYAPQKIIRRIAFSKRNTSYKLNSLVRLDKDKYKLAKIDRHLLQRCQWRNRIELACGSIDNFLQNGLGYCIIDNHEQIISEVYAPFWGKSHVEMGIFTAEAYRGKGFATIASAYLISVIEKMGQHAYWSCNQDNTSSISLAKKLGFIEPLQYLLLEYHT